MKSNTELFSQHFEKCWEKIHETGADLHIVEAACARIIGEKAAALKKIIKKKPSAEQASAYFQAIAEAALQMSAFVLWAEDKAKKVKSNAERHGREPRE